MRSLKDTYPDRTIFNPNNPEGTFKNRNDPETPLEPLETPYDEIWAQDLWGFISKMLFNAVITPDNSEENINYSQIFNALNYRIKQVNYQERYEYEGDGTDFTVGGVDWTTVKAKAITLYYPNALPDWRWKVFFFIIGTMPEDDRNEVNLTVSANVSVQLPYNYPVVNVVPFLNDDFVTLSKINAHCIGTNPFKILIKHVLKPTTRYGIYFFLYSPTQPIFAFNPDTYPVL